MAGLRVRWIAALRVGYWQETELEIWQKESAERCPESDQVSLARIRDSAYNTPTLTCMDSRKVLRCWGF